MSLPPINLGNVGQLAEPFSKLIDVLAKGTGIGPLGTILQAKADAISKGIATRTEIANKDLLLRAQTRFEYREALRQENLETIASLAAMELPKNVSADAIQTDWVLQFFDEAQDVCDDDMQIIWARILAGEVAIPRSYSKRTLQFLKTLDKSDALKFSELCSFGFYKSTRMVFHRTRYAYFIRNF